MRKRFVIALDSGTKAQNDQLLEYITSGGYGWWSWINGFWLLVDPAGKLDANKLRVDLGNIYPSVKMLILEIHGNADGWSGFGPNGDGDKSMFTWLKENWN